VQGRLPAGRTRLAVGLTSLAVIALELALMRTMSLRFWHHFAGMVLSVALLGFGASGTFLTLLRRRVRAGPRAWFWALSLGFALSIPLSLLAAERVPLYVRLLAWDLWQAGWVLLVELALFVPFLLAAGAIGVALMDRPERLGGHYAANLLGSGLGGLAAVGLMHVLTTGELLSVTSAAALLAAAVIAPWRRVAGAAAVALAAAALTLFAFGIRYEPTIPPEKSLPQELSKEGARLLLHTEGPLGRLDVVSSGSHYAPWLSLAYGKTPPSQVLMILDGDAICPVYQCPRREDWRFTDYTTAAAGYHVRDAQSVLIVGAGGGGEIGLAVFHQVPRIVALEMNGQVIKTMRGALRELGGSIYDAPGVEVVNREARGYLASAGGGAGRFDLIQVPPIDAFGAAGGGLHAASESYLYTVESLEAMLAALRPGGLLCVSRVASSPPRDGLRVLDTAAEALRRKGRDPRRHLAMIRAWSTVTVLAFASPITDGDAERIRRFCRERSFDLCWLPGMKPQEANQYHQLERLYFFEGAAALLGPQRRQYLDEYLYEVAAATDDRPYFHHFFRWRTLEVIRAQRGIAAQHFLELGYLMLLAALGQAALLAAVLILLPLAALRRAAAARGKAATLGYFLLLGAAFMTLEMGFLQKFILYLADPIYSAAVVIAGFLIFAGVGSGCSRRWRGALRNVMSVAAACVAGLSLVLVFVLDGWLAWTQAQPLAVRIVVALATIAPLAFGMGHMFPTGLRGVSAAAPALVPWAWAVNGFASVLAAVGAPLLAMHIGFSGLTVAAIACYAAAGALGRKLPAAGDPASA
jgi:hypothetical protein